MKMILLVLATIRVLYLTLNNADFAGTNNAPQNIWMTKSGTESNMSFGIPIRDDDRIEFRVAAQS